MLANYKSQNKRNAKLKCFTVYYGIKTHSASKAILTEKHTLYDTQNKEQISVKRIENCIHEIP